MNKQLLIKGCIIIVFIICGILYINNQFDSIDSAKNQSTFLENDMREDVELFSELSSDNTEEVNTNDKEERVDADKERKHTEEKTEEVFLYVYICGAVENPGVYSLREGSRIIDVLNMAGGALEDADLNLLNLAERIVDEQKIYIPKIGEEIDKTQIKVENRNDNALSIEPKAAGSDTVQNSLININTASSEQLQSLPGIGKTIAQNIIDYRNTNGPFQSINEIKNVPRIGEKTFEKIKDKITVN